MSQITTHILDTTLGRPAAGVAITLAVQQPAGGWQELGRGTTDGDGRLRTLLPAEAPVAPGVYRLKFFTQAYFDRLEKPAFYPFVEIIFTIVATDEHYHVPLLLNPFGFSTYRGS